MPIEWKPLGKKVTLQPGEIEALWIEAAELIFADDDISHIRIKVEGRWSIPVGPGMACGPDGVPNLALAERMLILTNCLPGCLIGRLGGSSAGAAAGAPAAEATAPPLAGFPIGTVTALPVPAAFLGSLFVGFNLSARPVTLQSLELEILTAKLPPPPV